MLPAVCFILSRKQIEIACKEVTTVLLEDDSKVGYIIRRECEQILRSKINNFQEYLELPEYIALVSLLEKGIAMHHSGLIPIFREIVEILFMKGYIKLLFATETISVGINTPTKTVIFTDVKKYDGTGIRMLLPHEFVQASGRAGRRGLDTVGHVIHLNNLFRNVELTEYKIMMQGKPQTLVSKFKISYNLLLNLIDIDDQDYLQFCKRSMAQEDLDMQLGGIYQDMAKVEQELQQLEESFEYLRTPKHIVERYLDITEMQKTAVNKKRKEMDKEIQQIQCDYKYIETDKNTIRKYSSKQSELTKIKQEYENTEMYLLDQIHILLQFLEKSKFICEKPDKPKTYDLTIQGTIAAHLREVHCLTFARLLESNELNKLSSIQLAALFSCFTNVTVADELVSLHPQSNDPEVNAFVQTVKTMYDEYQDFEHQNQMITGVDYSMQYDLIDYVAKWSAAESAPECKQILQQLLEEKGIFLGEFVKAILKINNISSEMEKIAESIGNMELLQRLKEIPNNTLKFVATNQSLYL